MLLCGSYVEVLSFAVDVQRIILFFYNLSCIFFQSSTIVLFFVIPF
jgi:hypothetical protein